MGGERERGELQLSSMIYFVGAGRGFGIVLEVPVYDFCGLFLFVSFIGARVRYGFEISNAPQLYIEIMLHRVTLILLSILIDESIP